MSLERWVNKIICGDCVELMEQLPPGCVHCCVTSPPYYGLRDYGTAKWEGGSAECDHVLENKERGDGDKKSLQPRGKYLVKDVCPKCGARRIDPQIGLEKTPEKYIEKLVLVFREVKRVMHPTGTLWLNMGDSYWGGKGQSSQAWSTENTDRDVIQGEQHQICGKGETRPTDRKHESYKPKDLMEIPSDLVRALRADGWWLRSRIPWLKRNAMPESCGDRPTQAVEYVFLLSKSEKYFYDGEAVRVKRLTFESRPDGIIRNRIYGYDSKENKLRGFKTKPNLEKQPQHHGQDIRDHSSGRSRRNSDWFFESWQGLWTDENGEPVAFIVNPQAFKQAHFATFPEGLVIPCLKAGTSEKGACPECGNPWVRVTETKRINKSGWGKQGLRPEDIKDRGKYSETTASDGDRKRIGYDVRLGPTVQSKTLGWRPTCSCGKEPVPCLVFDPFMGAGTVALVAQRMGRSYLGFEISEEYIKMSEQRLAQEILL